MDEHLKETIEKTIVEYEHSKIPYKMWKAPLIKTLSVENKQLAMVKQMVSPGHLVPRDILPDAQSIVSFFIPFQKEIILSNIEGRRASKEWALAYIYTNDLIKVINDTIEKVLAKHGYRVGKIPATHNFDTDRLISDWSHRHIAYIAGIGTFGINNMLITEAGCCGRLGSIITNYVFKDHEELKTKREKCLNKRNGNCGICQTRCEAKVYENGQFDRKKCYATCLMNSEYYTSIGYADVCGKCMVGLPCSMDDPSKNREPPASQARGV
jgi:epoxyqueuosine reductase QueG